MAATAASSCAGGAPVWQRQPAPPAITFFGVHSGHTTEHSRACVSDQLCAAALTACALAWARWTKSMLRGRGGCYKHSFYGIESHRCALEGGVVWPGLPLGVLRTTSRAMIVPSRHPPPPPTLPQVHGGHPEPGVRQQVRVLLAPPHQPRGPVVAVGNGPRGQHRGARGAQGGAGDGPRGALTGLGPNTASK